MSAALAIAPTSVTSSRASDAPAKAAAGPGALDGASDEALMRAYVAGDRRAFRVLFARLAPRLHGFFLRHFRSAAVADDLLQTTFLKLHGARASYDPNARLRPWVYTIAARVRLDELRRRYRVPRVAGDADTIDATVAADVPDAPHRIEASERAARVRRAVDALPEGQRVVIDLHRFEGLTFGEIATILDMREGAVRVRAFRAYERLRDALGDLLDPDGDDASPPEDTR